MTLDTEEPCGKWMPRKKTRCARKPGHGGPCKTSEAMALAVKRKAESVRVNGRRRYPETKRRWRQAYKLWRYGLTKEQFGRLLTAQRTPAGCAVSRLRRGVLSAWTTTTPAARGRRCRAASAFAGCCAGRATLRWGTSSGSPSWPACTWPTLPPSSSRNSGRREGPGKDPRLRRVACDRAGATGARRSRKDSRVLRGQETGRFPLTETTFHSGLVSVTASVRT